MLNVKSSAASTTQYSDEKEMSLKNFQKMLHATAHTTLCYQKWMPHMVPHIGAILFRFCTSVLSVRG